MKIKRLIEQMQTLLESLSESGQLLWEQANSRKVQRERVWALSDEIYEHLAKIILFGKEYQTTVHHWVSEVLGHMRKCMRNTVKIGGKPRYLTQTELYQWLTENLYVEDMTGLKNFLSGEYEVPQIDDMQLYEQILKGYRIITSLAAKQDFNINHYEKELEQLILF